MAWKRKNPGSRASSLAGRRPVTYLTVALFMAMAGFLALLFYGSSPVMAQKYIRNEEPVPKSVDKVVAPIDLAFQEKRKIPRFFPWLREQLKDTTPFLRDTQLDLSIRSSKIFKKSV